MRVRMRVVFFVATLERKRWIRWVGVCGGGVGAGWGFVGVGVVEGGREDEVDIVSWTGLDW